MIQDTDTAYLTGKLLLATPSIGDARFHRAVIFVAAHDENGAMGLIINFPLRDLEFSRILDQLGITSDIDMAPNLPDIPVLNGGPVEGVRGFLLHSSKFSQADTVIVDDHFSITGTTDALKEVAAGNGPEQTLFILGYAGWTAGQLEQELQQNSWLVADPDPSLVFHDDPDAKWVLAIKQLGFDPAMLSGEAGRA